MENIEKREKNQLTFLIMNEDLLVQCSNAVVMLVKSKTEKRRYNKTSCFKSNG